MHMSSFSESYKSIIYRTCAVSTYSNISKFENPNLYSFFTQITCTDINYFTILNKLAQSTISRYLMGLHEVNILGFKVVGNNSFYHINTETVQQVVDYLTHIRISTRQPSNYDMIYFKPKTRHHLPYSLRN